MALSLLLLLFFGDFCASQVILSPPDNATVFMKGFASFSCETKDGSPTWMINGTVQEQVQIPAMDLSSNNTITDSGSRLNYLTIRAKEEFNGTRIQCRVVNPPNTPTLSDNAFLMIQGLLSAPSKLRATSNGTSVTIWWSPPFSLIPDIWYSVFIYNVTDENNPTAIFPFNTTNTLYTFGSNCPNKYLASVIPVNEVGLGESSDNVTNCKENCTCAMGVHPTPTKTGTPQTSIFIPDGGGGVKKKDADVTVTVGAVVGAVVFIAAFGIPAIVIVAVVVLATKRRRQRNYRVTQEESGDAIEMSEHTPTTTGVRQSTPAATADKRTLLTKHGSANVSSSVAAEDGNIVGEQPTPNLARHPTEKVPVIHELRTEPTPIVECLLQEQGVEGNKDAGRGSTYTTSLPATVNTINFSTALPHMTLKPNITTYPSTDSPENKTKELMEDISNACTQENLDARIEDLSRVGESEMTQETWNEDPDVGGGAANFEVTPQESSAQPQDGGAVTVASELSAPLSSDREVETRGSKR